MWDELDRAEYAQTSQGSWLHKNAEYWKTERHPDYLRWWKEQEGVPYPWTADEKHIYDRLKEEDPQPARHRLQ